MDKKDNDHDGYANDLIGWNFSSNNNTPRDYDGHGTHVAGIIGAMGNNGAGVTGIDWNVTLMPIQFLDSNGHGSISQFILGLDYAVAHGAKISNNSWTGADPSQALTNAINNARSHGMIFVAAAGNDGTSNDNNPAYPASYPQDNVVTVAASDQKNQLADFSNFGAKSVDLAAPGVSILSTLPDGYGTMSGTSMAAPMVTGVLALVWSQHPDWSYLQVIKQVETTVTKVPDLAGKVVTGGILNAAAAVGAVAASSMPAQIISAIATGPSPNTLSSIRVTFDRGIIPSSFTPSDLTLFSPKGTVHFTGVKVVAGTSNRTFDLIFPVQRTPGTYTLYVGSDARDRAGNRIARYQKQFKITAPRPTPKPAVTSTTFTSRTVVAIPALGRGVSLLKIGQNLVISHLTVTLNIQYPHVGDLYIHLQSPDGTNIVLAPQVGGQSANFKNTIFDDSAPKSIGFATTPFADHSYQPMVPLKYLNGKNAQGTWKLWIENHGKGMGTLTNWSLTITS